MTTYTTSNASADMRNWVFDEETGQTDLDMASRIYGEWPKLD
jgi:hypothetical protein